MTAVGAGGTYKSAAAPTARLNLILAPQALNEQCYAHVLGVLRYLVSPEAAGDAGERLQRSAQLSADDRAAFLQALLQVRPSSAGQPTRHVSCCVCTGGAELRAPISRRRLLPRQGHQDTFRQVCAPCHERGRRAPSTRPAGGVCCPDRVAEGFAGSGAPWPYQPAVRARAGRARSARRRRRTRRSGRRCSTRWWSCARRASCCSWTAPRWSGTCARPAACPSAGRWPPARRSGRWSRRRRAPEAPACPAGRARGGGRAAAVQRAGRLLPGG